MRLAGDIGGTKTHLALYDGDRLIKDEKFPSAEFPGLVEIIRKFHTGKVDKACFGIAGPVRDGRCKATNLPWAVDAKKLGSELNISKVWLINDLEATAWGIGCLKPNELATLNEGIAQKGNQAVIAAGTGLGEAGLYWNGNQHIPFSCEGGHADFAPRNEDEINLWHYLQKKYDHVSYERVLSGPGMEHLFWFLVESKKRKERLEGEIPRLITEKGLSGESETCREVLDWFASIYGGEAGNLALKFLALGGVYVGGGIAPRILKVLQNGSFMGGFLAKGRFDELLKTIPIKVILNDNAALLGAAEYVRFN
jgi:glucokinase